MRKLLPAIALAATNPPFPLRHSRTIDAKGDQHG